MTEGFPLFSTHTVEKSTQMIQSGHKIRGFFLISWDGWGPFGQSPANSNVLIKEKWPLYHKGLIGRPQHWRFLSVRLSQGHKETPNLIQFGRQLVEKICLWFQSSFIFRNPGAALVFDVVISTEIAGFWTSCGSWKPLTSPPPRPLNKHVTARKRCRWRCLTLNHPYMSKHRVKQQTV